MEHDIISIKYNSEYSVVAANRFIRSKQDDLTLLEAKLVRLVVAQVLLSDTDFRTYTCRAIELANFLDISQDNIYRDIDTVCLGLMRKVIKIAMDEDVNRRKRNYEAFHWVSYCNYNNGLITIRLAEELKPYLLGIDELFSVYEYSSILNLPTTYAIRFYELIVSFQNMTVQKTQLPDSALIGKYKRERNQFIFTNDYLREYFNCADKYPNTGNFLLKVIEPAIKAINENTIMLLSYEKIKEGRNIVAIRVTMLR